MKYVLDTNVCIFAIQRPRSKVAMKIKAIANQQIAISVVTAAELLAGSNRKKSTQRQTELCARLIALFRWIPFDTPDAKTFGRIGAIRLDHGQMIGSLDLQIAATALNRNLTVVTHNFDEFSRVPGLAIEDWQAELRESP